MTKYNPIPTGTGHSYAYRLCLFCLQFRVRVSNKFILYILVELVY